MCGVACWLSAVQMPRLSAHVLPGQWDHNDTKPFHSNCHFPQRTHCFLSIVLLFVCNSRLAVSRRYNHVIAIRWQKHSWGERHLDLCRDLPNDDPFPLKSIGRQNTNSARARRIFLDLLGDKAPRSHNSTIVNHLAAIVVSRGAFCVNVKDLRTLCASSLFFYPSPNLACGLFCPVCSRARRSRKVAQKSQRCIATQEGSFWGYS
jgi:hypothetical protein